MYVKSADVRVCGCVVQFTGRGRLLKHGRGLGGTTKANDGFVLARSALWA